MPSKIITKETKEKMITFYKSRPMTQNVVADRFGYSLPTVIKILKEYRIKPYSKVKLFSPKLKEHYFYSIDDEYKAYFLGLIITDGCIYSKNNRQNLVSLTLKDEDKYIIEKFKEVIKSEKKVTSDGRGASSINILSNIMVEDLKRYGLSDKKSLSTIFPDSIPSTLYPHLIRGILDGDGSVSFYARPNKKSHTKAIRFCQGNEKFLVDIVNFLDTHIGIKPVNTYKEKESLWSIAYRSNKSLYQLYHYLYDNATIYLKRKKILCDKIINEIDYYHGDTEITNCSKEQIVL